MKKIILTIAVIALGISSVACRKERTCECKTTTTRVVTGDGAGTYVDNTSYKITKDKQKKKSFKYSSSCFSESYVYYDSDNGPTPDWTSTNTVDTKCELN